MEHNYSIVIQWSEQSSCFIASLPEWGENKVKGESYEQVLANARQTIALLVKSCSDQGKLLPTLETFQRPSLAH
ncbi:MAG: type II toxin-antitoxin system HicB family antitoxin [Cyanobacteria bacterium J06600_6]